ncbi:MAG: aminotransferase class V-fold PLP-dependent enzyme [Proteobacteria bacterium]|jgi:alanine-glyoxylate transaminase / serine-glyoxylate transaminase / serine-pyruvate transaminase|nr:aminotransferase class V-fold PLP-dependent enzyme [Pseudomonadota bacterium]
MQRDFSPAINPRSNLNRVGQGRHFLQIPGPSNVPDRILRAIDFPTIDHRGPEFQALALKLLEGIRPLFGTKGPVVIYPASGTAAWEAALVNTMNVGDHILMFEAGHFAGLWMKMASRLGLKPEVIKGDWGLGVQADLIEARLKADSTHQIKAVCVVHNETSTGVTSDIAAVRRAMDAAGHPALLLVDTISALGSVEFKHDEWGVDVSIASSQKGLMMPPGLGFNAVSEKALAASQHANMPRAFWAWDDILEANKNGFWPSTPNTNLLYGLGEAIDMFNEEGLPQVFARHKRHAQAARSAAAAWGLELVCQAPALYSPVLTAVRMPLREDGSSFDADHLREVALRACNMSLGMGLGQLSGKVFRIGHLGDFNDLSLVGALGGVEMALRAAAVPHRPGGTQAALDSLRHSLAS